MFLFNELWKLEKKNYKQQAKELEQIDKSDKLKKLFSLIEFEDVKVSNANLEIMNVLSHNKPKRKGDKIRKWPDQVLEMLIKWEFQIKINDLQWFFSKQEIESMIKDYSTYLIAREEQIVENIKWWLTTDIIEILDDYMSSWKYPVKIWMFKKSLAYKIFWEEMLEYLNKIEWKRWLELSRKWWIWDKTLYTDENYNPIWWISLEIKD